MFDRSYVRPSVARPEGFDRMVVLSSMPALWTPAHLQEIWLRMERAPRLARAGDVVYADQPRQRPGRAPYHARGGRRYPPSRHASAPRAQRSTLPATRLPFTEGAPVAARAPSPSNPPRHVG